MLYRNKHRQNFLPSTVVTNRRIVYAGSLAGEQLLYLHTYRDRDLLLLIGCQLRSIRVWSDILR